MIATGNQIVSAGKPYYPELSSIRGIAAIVVLFGHAFDMIDKSYGTPTSSTVDVVNTAFDFIALSLNGNAAVEIFFVLSGLVLSLSLNRRDGIWLGWGTAFYIRRIFRIYPALWISLLLAISLLPFEVGACASQICTPWAAAAFHQSYTLSQIVLSFLGDYVHINGPMWSLRVELFFSFVFPFIFLSLRINHTRWLALLVFFSLAIMPIPRIFSVHYVLAFALGSLIPLLYPSNQHIPYRAIALFAVVTLIFSPLVLFRLHLADKTLEIIEMFASFTLVYIIFHRKLDLVFLRNRVLFYLGEISYSIYVLHFPLLFALFYAEQRLSSPAAIQGSPNLSTLILGLATFATAAGLSALTFRFIEMPFQSLGQIASRRFSAALRV